MTTPTYQLLMPAALAGGAGLIASRNPGRYPALLAWSGLTAFFVGAVWGDARYPTWILGAAAAVLPFQIREVLIKSRISVPWGEFTVLTVGVALASVTAALLVAPTHVWTVARSYYQLAAMAIMLAATFYRWRNPILEHRRDVVYRVGMTLWLCVKAPASTFVRGGLGTQLFPTVSRDAVEQWCYCLLIVCFSGMALAMWAQSRGRKRAAKRRDGRTVTGLIEMERAA